MIHGGTRQPTVADDNEAGMIEQPATATVRFAKILLKVKWIPYSRQNPAGFKLDT